MFFFNTIYMFDPSPEAFLLKKKKNYITILLIFCVQWLYNVDHIQITLPLY